MTLFLIMAIGLPILGWLFMVADYRAYVRSLRRAIAVIQSMTRKKPNWIYREEWISDRPACLTAFDLVPPCTREQVLASYRQKVKGVHPDHGGNRAEFERLQRHLEEALRWVDSTNEQS